MYYIGTKTKCLSYDSLVTKGRNYNGVTTNWSKTIKRYNKNEFAILKHNDYESDMTLVNELPSDWFEAIE